MKAHQMIEQKFKDTRARNEAALIVYCTAGYPDLDQSFDLVQLCVECGADIIEIGVPFSDPVADGDSIQYSSHRALTQGVTLGATLQALAHLELDVPIAIMSYLNPILAFGWDRFLNAAANAGVSGLIVPDLPVEEAVEIALRTQQYKVDLVLLAAPTSTRERLRRITDISRGFIYCVSMAGITGVRASIDKNTKSFLQRVRALTDKPCTVGFGISAPEHIQALRNEVDGVVVGSRIIEGIRNGEDIPELIHIMKEATRR